MLQKRFLMKIIPIGIIIVFLSIAQFKIYLKNFDKYLVVHIEAAKGVVDGYPHWRIFQNRIAGPYAVKFTQEVTGLTFSQSYMLTSLIWMMMFYSTMMAVAISIRPSLVFAFGAMVAAAFFNTFLMRGLWLYTWDLIDLVVFTLFIWAILKEKPIGYLICILVFETFNREVSLIMAGWLFADSLLSVRPNRDTGRFPTITIAFEKPQAIISLLLIVFIAFTTEYLRDTLMVRQIGPEYFSDFSGSAGLVMFKLWDNIKFLFFSFTDTKGLSVAYSILIISLPIFSILGVFSRNRQTIRISLFYMILWVSAMIFGVIYETRIWLAYIPFLVIACPMILQDMEERVVGEKT
ncbi:MAG: hypothetical protein C4522_16800 [Desulfobacteraceae bacterium]|nr:MAG: hypothetical protein C4522_16800 [Desulfobacteraceae bacterium]